MCRAFAVEELHHYCCTFLYSFHLMMFRFTISSSFRSVSSSSFLSCRIRCPKSASVPLVLSSTALPPSSVPSAPSLSPSSSLPLPLSSSFQRESPFISDNSSLRGVCSNEIIFPFYSRARSFATMAGEQGHNKVLCC